MLFFYDAVDFDASVGANHRTSCATYASVGIGRVGVVVAAVVNIIGAKGEGAGRACYDAQFAAFASHGIDCYGS